MNENVLVLGLHHVLALRPQISHARANVQGALVAQSFQLAIDDDERPGATNAGTGKEGTKVANCWVILTRTLPIDFFSIFFSLPIPQDGPS